MKALTCRCGLTLAEHHANYGCRRGPTTDTYQLLLESITGRPTWPQPPAADVELRAVVINEERKAS